MTQKLGIIRTVSLLAIGLSAAGFVAAQGDQYTTAVPKGSIAQPTPVQQTPVPTVGSVSRPGKFGVLGVQDSISVALTVTECTNLGGKVDDVSTKTCASGKQCATADRDGVIRTKCIDHKEN